MGPWSTPRKLTTHPTDRTDPPAPSGLEALERRHLLAAYLGWVDLIGVGGSMSGLLATAGVAGPHAVILGVAVGITSWAIRAKLG